MSLQSLDRLDHNSRIQIQTLSPLNNLLINGLIRMIHDDNSLILAVRSTKINLVKVNLCI